jgi:NIMA (never in mitosis gene a)-related kinase 1/4/5
VARTIVGTPYYLSPEIIENAPYNFKSDMWSLGVLLYEIIALKPPFNGASLHLLALQIVRGVFQAIPGHFSDSLRKMVASLIQKDPAKRPSINQLLKTPIIANKVKGFLSDEEFKNEFAHTILHKQNAFNKTQNQLLIQAMR